MVFTVDGVNLLPYLAENGLKWQRNDVEAADSGRTLDGTMHRARVATKIRLDVTCRSLTQAEAAIVLNAIRPMYVSVTYQDPQDGTVTKTMYANNNPATIAAVYDNGTVLWSGITFPLVER